MIEIGPDDLDHPNITVEVVFGTLTYSPRSPNFRAAKTALQHLGASYDWRTRAWSVPVTNYTVEPLKRLYRRTTLALWISEPGETISVDSFDRYRPESR